MGNNMDTRQHETNRDAFSAVASELRASQCANRLKAARNIAFDAYS
jgi:hypothetical protein